MLLREVSPIILLGLVNITSVLNLFSINTVAFFIFIKLIIFFLVPGYYLSLILSEKIKMSLDEIFAIEIAIGLSINALIPICLSYFFNKIYASHVSFILFVIVLIFGVFYTKHYRKESGKSLNVE